MIERHPLASCRVDILEHVGTIPDLVDAAKYRRAMPAEVDTFHTPSADHANDAFCDWFMQDYPRVVGLVRRVIDPEQAAGASLEASETLARDAFAQHRWSLPTEDRDRDLTKVIGAALDAALGLLDGHPGSVPPTAGLAQVVPIARLHDVLRGLRRHDRRVGLLAFAGGFSALEIAMLLERPLTDVNTRVGSVRRRIEQAGAASATVLVEGVR